MRVTAIAAAFGLQLAVRWPAAGFGPSRIAYLPPCGHIVLAELSLGTVLRPP
jgi:hypothetical protein